MRETITTVGELIGAALITIGVWSYSASVGAITLGVMVAGFSWLASR